MSKPRMSNTTETRVESQQRFTAERQEHFDRLAAAHEEAVAQWVAEHPGVTADDESARTAGLIAVYSLGREDVASTFTDDSVDAPVLEGTYRHGYVDAIRREAAIRQTQPTEAEATVLLASNVFQGYPEDGADPRLLELWNILDNYDGSLVNIKEVEQAAVARIMSAITLGVSA